MTSRNMMKVRRMGICHGYDEKQEAGFGLSPCLGTSKKFRLRHAQEPGDDIISFSGIAGISRPDESWFGSR